MKNVLIFLAGGIVGAIGVKLLLEEKYKKLAQEEIDSVKEAFSRRTSLVNEKEESGIADAKNLTNKAGYTETDSTENKVYRIDPEVFGELDEYTQSSLTYYADGVLTDEYDEPIDDIEETVGVENLKHFEEDALYIRNSGLRCDYEILKDMRAYHSVNLRKEE